ncbi:MAG TPA: hypothetical protein VFL79_12545 [Terriglobia bacterium]|nr:hypothetical protein [Terriglobia bacterium]
MLFKQMSEANEVERPWQTEIDRLQHTLQEVVDAVSNLSGVPLSEDGAALRESSAQAPLDCKSLKDRIRNDLESFATMTAAEMARQAERQTRIALAALQSEADGHAEQVARELREKFKHQFDPGHYEIGITQQTQDRVTELVQRRTDEFARWVWLMCKGTGTSIPEEIEKLLEPYVEQATGKLSESFRRRFDDELAEQENQAQRRLQGTLSTLEEQVNTLHQKAKKICEQNAASIAMFSADRLNSVAEEAMQGFRNRIREELETDFASFHTRLENTAAELMQKLQQEEENKAVTLNSRIAQLESEIKEKATAQISGHIEQTAANVIESSIQHLNQQAADTLEHSKEELKGFLELQMEEARLKINGLGQSAHESLAQEAERTAGSLKTLDAETAGARERSLVEAKDRLSVMVQDALASTRDRVSQLSEGQVAEIEKLVRGSRENEAAQYEKQLRDITDTWYNNLLERVQAEARNAAASASAEVKANADSVMQELSDKVDASALVLREETVQATSRIESLLKGSLETYERQLGEITGSRIDEHRQVIRKSLSDLQARLERSAQILRQEIAGTMEREARDATAGG